MRYKIEKNIPYSRMRKSAVHNIRNSAQEPKYPFSQMDIGDSFDFDMDESRTINAAATYYKMKNPGFKYSIKTNKTFFSSRIWRLQ